MDDKIYDFKALNIEAGEIKRWMVIGPFTAKDIDEEFISTEETDPNEVYDQNGRKIKWKSWYVNGNSPAYFSFNDQMANNRLNTYYLANYFYLRKECRVNFFFETNASSCWYINGRKKHTVDKNSKSKRKLSCTLKRGWNLVIVKCVFEKSNSNESVFHASITDHMGNEIESLLIKNGFILPDDTETHMFGKNPDDSKQAIEIGDTLSDYKRSNPDIVVYIPKEGDCFNDGDNEHFLVTKSSINNNLFAFWTQASAEAYGDNHIMMSRSKNGGLSWAEPQFVVGTSLGGNETQASWGIPLISKTGRIYCFYTKSKAGTPSGLSGIMGTMQSDDEGLNWQHGPDIVIPTTRQHPEAANSPIVGVFIAWQLPIRDAKGRQILAYSMWKNKRGRCFLMRFDNIDEGPDIKDLIITWLPDNNTPIEMPDYLMERECCEPSIVLLPDGRLFMTMRTMTGHIWCSISKDDGHTWCKPEILKYKDEGEKINHPLSCCPIYALKNGKYILLHYNNNYFAEKHFRGEEMPAGMNMFTHRRPLFVSVGTYMPNAIQPIWFGKPRMILDNGGVIVGPKATNEIGTYPSLTELEGRRILWYPDRKYYLLGKILTDELLGI